jgi:uroporphyrin-III C-methyltransferase
MTVHLVGAGPGAVDLLTVRALRLIESAEVLVHDRLVEPEILELVPANCEVIDVGKRPGHSESQALINSLLVSLGQSGRSVVRLKGGDPFVFGRGGEEFEALHAAGIPCSIVPGISSSFAAPLSAGVPVTHRGSSHGVTVVTGHAREGAHVDFRRLANPAITLVVLMGIGRRATIMAELLEGGLGRSTPLCVIENASRGTQRVVRATLEDLATLDVSSPAVIVIGEVASLRLSDEEFLEQIVGAIS